MSTGHFRFLFRMFVFCIASLSYSQTPSAQTSASVPTPHQQIAHDIFRDLINTNTANPNGTTKAVELLASRLKTAGFPDSDLHIDGANPEKANLVVRLRGKGKGKPILFLAHLDVVEARKEDWSPDLDPFQFAERDGYFYGRGSVDVKDEAAILIANFLRFKEERFVPDRDFIVALTAGEEDGEDNGVEWLIKNHRDWIESEFSINTDAGGGQLEKGRRVRYNVQTSEKSSVTFRLEVKNVGGHSSQPVKDNAIYHLAGGLARLGKYDFPVVLNDTTKTFFKTMSKYEPGQTAADMKSICQEVPDPEAAARLAASSPFFNSMMRTTCVATLLEGGHAYNALPQMARSVVNCRVRPEDTLENVIKTLNEVLADDQIVVTPLNKMASSPVSPLSPDLMGRIEHTVAEMWPGVPVVPVMDPWATDGFQLRRAGIPVYGTPAVFFDIDPIRAHGKDERVSVTAFYEGLEFMYRLMKTLAE